MYHAAVQTTLHMTEQEGICQESGNDGSLSCGITQNHIFIT